MSYTWKPLDPQPKTLKSGMRVMRVDFHNSELVPVGSIGTVCDAPEPPPITRTPKRDWVYVVWDCNPIPTNGLNPSWNLSPYLRAVEEVRLESTEETKDAIIAELKATVQELSQRLDAEAAARATADKALAKTRDRLKNRIAKVERQRVAIRHFHDLEALRKAKSQNEAKNVMPAPKYCPYRIMDIYDQIERVIALVDDPDFPLPLESRAALCNAINKRQLNS